MSLAGILGSLLTVFINKLLGRRRESVETSEISARTSKTEAETRQIDSAIVNNAYKRLDELEAIIHAMNIEKQKLIGENVKLDWELSLSQSRERIQAETIKQAHAELELLRKPRVL